MRPLAPAVLALALTFAPMHTSAQTAPTHAHVVNTFHFEVAASMARVAPLFAPEAERAWAGDDWKPVFLYPQPGKDVQGAVWTLRHGEVESIWVNTLFDVPNGRMQYVAFIPGHMVTTVDVRVTSLASIRTAVEVTYTRTALDPAANDAVQSRGNSDRNSGPEWQRGIEGALGLK